MGLIPSAHYFQQALEGIMRNHGILYERLAVDAQEFDSRDDAGEKVRGFVSIFLDDIILWSTDPETHKGNLMRLFEVLSKEKMSLNMKKCLHPAHLRRACRLPQQRLMFPPSTPQKLRRQCIRTLPSRHPSGLRGQSCLLSPFLPL